MYHMPYEKRHPKNVQNGFIMRIFVGHYEPILDICHFFHRVVYLFVLMKKAGLMKMKCYGGLKIFGTKDLHWTILVPF